MLALEPLSSLSHFDPPFIIPSRRVRVSLPPLLLEAKGFNAGGALWPEGMKVGGNELFYVVLELLFIHYLSLNPAIILKLITALLVATSSDFVSTL